MADEPPARGKHGSAPYAISPQSDGWLIAGASRLAGPRFIEAVRALPPLTDGSVRAWVAGIFSHSSVQARDFASLHQIAHFDHNLDGLLARDEIRFVYVANHPRHHGQTVLSALRAGKHVLCEPPLALNLDEAEYLHNAAANRGLTLAINYQHRCDPTIEVLRKMVLEDDLGTIVSGYVRNCVLLPAALHSWRVESAWGGVLYDRTLRSVDMIRFLLNDEIVRVQATGGPTLFGGKDAGRGSLEDCHTFVTMQKSAAVIQVHDSYLLPHAPSRIDLFGSSGSVTIMPWSESGASGMSIYRHGERLQVHVPIVNQMVRTLQVFAESVRTEQATLAGTAVEIDNLQICNAIQQSLTEAIAIQPTLRSGILR